MQDVQQDVQTAGVTSDLTPEEPAHAIHRARAALESRAPALLDALDLCTSAIERREHEGRLFAGDTPGRRLARARRNGDFAAAAYVALLETLVALVGGRPGEDDSSAPV